MAKKSAKQRKGKRSRTGNVSAPGQHLLGSSSNWNLRRIVPVFVQPSAQTGRNYFVQLIAGVNGYRYEVLDDSFQPFGITQGGLYGDTDQFTNLSKLWSTYRLIGVTARWTPSTLNIQGSLSPTLCIVDVLGGSDAKDFPESLGWYSRSKNMRIHTNFNTLERHVDYKDWLTQCVPQPYKRTDLLGTRELYETDTVVRLPGVQMGFNFNPSQNVSASQSGYLLGFFDLNAQYEFRGRKLDDAPIQSSPFYEPQAMPKDTSQPLTMDSVKTMSLSPSIAEKEVLQKYGNHWMGRPVP